MPVHPLAVSKSIRKVADIVQNNNEEVVMVTSAVGGVTDQLVKIAARASAGDQYYIQILGDLVILQ